MKWKILYVNRIFRIAPVYYTVFLIALIIIAFESHFKILGPPSELKNSLLKWLAIGYFECCLDINQFPTMKILGVAWTLRLGFRSFIYTNHSPCPCCTAFVF
eukprot:gene10108-11784_t